MPFWTSTSTVAVCFSFDYRQSDQRRRSRLYHFLEVLGDLQRHPYLHRFVSIPVTNAEDSFQQFLKAYRKYDFNLRYLSVEQNHLSLPSINHFFETLKKTQIPTLQSLTMGFSLSVCWSTEENLTDSGLGSLLDVSRTRALTSLKRLVLLSRVGWTLTRRLQFFVYLRLFAASQDPRGGIPAVSGGFGET